MTDAAWFLVGMGVGVALTLVALAIFLAYACGHAWKAIRATVQMVRPHTNEKRGEAAVTLHRCWKCGREVAVLHEFSSTRSLSPEYARTFFKAEQLQELMYSKEAPDGR